MQLRTLNYIHRLLIDAEKSALTAKKHAYEVKKNAKGEENYKDLCDEADKAREVWFDARQAREDFENQSW